MASKIIIKLLFTLSTVYFAMGVVDIFLDREEVTNLLGKLLSNDNFKLSSP